MIGAPPWSPFRHSSGGGAAVPTGKSYSFDGVDEYVLTNGAIPAVDWDGINSWSISTWFKNGGTTGTPLYIWSACAAVAATNRFMGISTFVSGGVPYIRFVGIQPSVLIEDVKSPSGGGGYVQVRSTDPNGITPGDGNWHNVTLTVNTVASTAQGVKMYLDGLPAGYAQSAAITLDWPHFVFGCRVQTNGAVLDSEFPGLIHQASIYNSELTAGEVAAVYNAGSPPDEMTLTPSPLNYYRFGNGDVLFPTLKDYGSSPQDGTAVNMTAASIVDDAPP